MFLCQKWSLIALARGVLLLAFPLFIYRPQAEILKMWVVFPSFYFELWFGNFNRHVWLKIRHSCQRIHRMKSGLNSDFFFVTLFKKVVIVLVALVALVSFLEERRSLHCYWLLLNRQWRNAAVYCSFAETVGKTFSNVSLRRACNCFIYKFCVG